ncbi:MAG: Cell cycle checkpoint protein rad17 [Geoglossum umbratile]|nr:MAG: Cell cycle checkpoint protein rad17 [Geoglossum umbratile]
MVPPKAKRPKRKIVQSSEDESECQIDSGSPLKKKKKLLTRKPGHSGRAAGTTNGVSSPSKVSLPAKSLPKRTPRKPTGSSPEKSKGKAKNGGKPSNTRSIYTFFTSSTQQQRSAQGAKCPIPEEEKDDIIQDNSQDEDYIDSRDASGISRMDNTQGGRAASHGITSASRKFIIKGGGAGENAPTDAHPVASSDLRPWSEKYAPMNLDELAVHKKKVADVRAWLESVFGGRDRKRLLILKGPSGTGKTTTMSLLSKDMDVDVLEWRNPVGMELSSEGFVSMSAQFEEFLGRGGKFGSLDLSSSVGNSGGDAPEAASTSKQKKIILVEEFPNTFTRSSSALQSFQFAIKNFLASNCPSLGILFSSRTPPNEQITPLVLIISETLLTTTTASADSFTAHRLLGPEILNHPGVSLINFNPVAPTLLAKALELVIQKEARITGRRKTPSRLTWDKLGEVGDVRSAVGSLEFLCLRGDDSGDWGGKVTFGKGRKRSKETALTNMERESLELVTQREASLGIFHAVGKVVYNKRVDDSLSSTSTYSLPQPPDHLSQHARLRRSQVSVDELIDETGTDTQTFISALHENYVLSCGILSSEASLLDSVNCCIDSLSDSDLLCPNWGGGFGSGGMGGGFGRGTFQGAGADSLRQDEISFQIAVRGILFSLPYPVKRKSPPSSGSGASWNKTGGMGDAHKMFYPTALKLWRQTEEIKGNVDTWISRFMKGEVTVNRRTPSHAAPEAKSGSIESWRSNFKERADAHPTGDVPTTTPTLLSGGSAAHREMILERLPYMAKIQFRDPIYLREIEKVTLFRGIAAQSDEIPDEDEEIPAIQWATDHANERGSTPRKKPRAREFETNGASKDGLGFQIPVEKVESLALSDDDIEDD